MYLKVKSHKYDRILLKINFRILILKNSFQLNFHAQFIISVIIFISNT